MREHLEACDRCSALDHRVRRALIVARNNIPTIELSRDFRDRFSERLALERTFSTRSRGLRLGAVSLWALAATGVLVAGYRAYASARSSSATPVGTITALPTSELGAPVPNPELTTGPAASVSSGFPVVPALLLAEEAPAPLSPVVRPAFHQVIARQ